MEYGKSYLVCKVFDYVMTSVYCDKERGTLAGDLPM